MALGNWFGPKAGATSAKPAAGRLADDAPASRPSTSEERRATRGEHREQLYAVVRDAMTRAGVLTSSYKFKVLSLDSLGQSFLVMVDLASSAKEDSCRLSEIEALVAHNAKMRHNLQVVAVYWRLSDHVTAGLAPRPAGALDGAAHMQTAAKASAVDINEMLAFKQAFAAMPGGQLSASGQVVRSGRRGPELAPEPADSTLGEDAGSPLGPTQYGDLR